MDSDTLPLETTEGRHALRARVMLMVALTLGAVLAVCYTFRPGSAGLWSFVGLMLGITTSVALIASTIDKVDRNGPLEIVMVFGGIVMAYGLGSFVSFGIFSGLYVHSMAASLSETPEDYPHFRPFVSVLLRSLLYIVVLVFWIQRVLAGTGPL